jgi:hypothetical protein
MKDEEARNQRVVISRATGPKPESLSRTEVRGRKSNQYPAKKGRTGCPMRPLGVFAIRGSVLDLALDGSSSLGQVTSTGADIFPNTLDGVAGGKAGGGDGKKEEGKEVFHRS